MGHAVTLRSRRRIRGHRALFVVYVVARDGALGDKRDRLELMKPCHCGRDELLDDLVNERMHWL